MRENPNGKAMKILITGSTGLIGAALLPALRGAGHEVVGLPRTSSSSRGWNPATGAIDAVSLDHADAIVHLAGANIGECRWTSSRKQLILESRVGPTTALSRFLASNATHRPTLIVASAVGFFGDRGDEWLDETSPAGDGFLAGVVEQWEASTKPAVEAGIRVVKLRFGIILTPNGGALKRMLLPFRFGLGGRIGHGRQYWSWVGLDDVIGAVQHVLRHSEINGPVNVVSPNPVTNSEFTRTLARVMSRPSVFPLPAFAARLVLGEMADELLLYSARVKPAKLSTSGYQFRGTNLDETLRQLLSR
jgi:uncharacterized protein (TIGR01777 family)